MIEFAESGRTYDNKMQYFYKNNELFYAYIEFDNANEDNDERTTEKYKLYFEAGNCVLHLFNNSYKNKEYSEYSLKSNDVLKESIDFIQRTKNNKWNEF